MIAMYKGEYAVVIQKVPLPEPVFVLNRVPTPSCRGSSQRQQNINSMVHALPYMVVQRCPRSVRNRARTAMQEFPYARIEPCHREAQPLRGN